MILTGHQPTYLPWLGLFNKIVKSDCFVLFDNVQYLPKEWMNKNQIKSPNGKVFLTVPVLDKSYLKKKIFEIEINNNLNWRRKHLKTIKLNYQSSKYFHYYFSYFEDLYSREWKYLIDLNFEFLKLLMKFLGLRTKIIKLSDLGVLGKKSELVLNLCKKLKAKKFIFGAQGLNYANIDSFEKENIEPVFQNFEYPEYEQLFGKFISDLSIIDLLFNKGEDSINYININKSFYNKDKKIIKL